MTPRQVVTNLLAAALPDTSCHMTGARQILDNAADSAPAAGPPSKAQEVTYAASWAATTLAAASLYIETDY